MAFETRHIKYVFADVVGFTRNRTVEAQVEIIEALNAAFRLAATSMDCVYLPTGDGVCLGIVDPTAPYDAHLTVALRVLEQMVARASSVSENRRCEVRFSINESVDVILLDINGHRNLAGSGINQAQRLLTLADGGQIVVGHSAFQSLQGWDRYVESFRSFRAEVKHGVVLTAYQYIDERVTNLNCQMPDCVLEQSPIDINLTERLNDPDVYTTTDMVGCYVEATEAWESELQDLLLKLNGYCSPKQMKALELSQKNWVTYRDAHADFLSELYSEIRGTMRRITIASTMHEITRRRVESLKRTVEDWFEPEN
jgi:uncharacterized protein YecT (DUF1311 family)